jgi:hypothetical protein
MLHDIGGKTLPGLVDIRCQLRGLQSQTKEILDHVRPKPATPVSPTGNSKDVDPNLGIIRAEARKAPWESLREILSGATILALAILAALIALSIRGIQDRKDIRRLTERLEVVERVAQPRK